TGATKAKDEKKKAAAPEPEIAEEQQAIIEDPVDEVAEAQEPEPAADEVEEPAVVAAEPEPEPAARAAPGFSKLLDSIAGLTGFYGSQPVRVEPVIQAEVP